MLGSFLLTIGVGLITYGIVGGGLYFPVFSFGITDQFRQTGLLGCLSILIGLLLLRGKPAFSPNTIIFLPFLLLLSHNQFSGKAFFSHYFYVAEFLVLLALFFVFKPPVDLILKFFVLVLILGSGYNYFRTVGDTLIFSDDLPSFYYRFNIILNSNFLLPSYDPFWNMGTNWTDIFATGSIPVGLLFYFFRPLGLFESFNVFVFFIVFVLSFLTVFTVSRILKFDKFSTLIFLILGLCSSLHLFRWGLKYGTLGYIFSAHFCLIAGSILVSWNKNATALSKIALWICLFLGSFWPLNILCLVPLLAQVLIFNGFSINLVVLLATSLALPIATIFHGLIYSEFFDRWLITRDTGYVFHHGIKELLRNTLLGINPLILFSVPFGFLHVSNSVRLLIIGYLVAALGFGSVLPKLELSRVASHLGIALAVPAAVYISSIFGRLNHFCKCLLTSMLILSCLQTILVFKNASFDTFSVLEKPYLRFIEWSNNSDQKRFLFLGHMLHDFSGGHLAVLPYLVKKEFVAYFPTHRSWKPIEIVPVADGRKTHKFENAVDAICPDFLITNRRFWKRIISKNSKIKKNKYRRVFHFGPFSVFKRASTCHVIPFSEALKVRLNEIEFYLPEDQEFVPVKYAFNKHLKVDGCDAIIPVDVSGFTLIGLRNCSRGSIRIFNSLQK
ncbi:MAG: hypothetical protein NZT61_00130 [Deltaproteobacteria bacterium]|nr:hypothetical protein [Deltaproteobacteria bacterium]